MRLRELLMVPNHVYEAVYTNHGGGREQLGVHCSE